MYQGPSFIMGVASFIMGVASFIMGVASLIMGVASFIMGVASFIMGVASFIMGVASFIMGVASFIMGMASFMGWIDNCSVNTYCTVYLSYYATYRAGFCSYWIIVSSAVVLDLTISCYTIEKKCAI